MNVLNKEQTLKQSSLIKKLYNGLEIEKRGVWSFFIFQDLYYVDKIVYLARARILSLTITDDE